MQSVKFDYDLEEIESFENDFKSKILVEENKLSNCESDINKLNKKLKYLNQKFENLDYDITNEEKKELIKKHIERIYVGGDKKNYLMYRIIFRDDKEIYLLAKLQQKKFYTYYHISDNLYKYNSINKTFSSTAINNNNPYFSDLETVKDMSIVEFFQMVQGEDRFKITFTI